MRSLRGLEWAAEPEAAASPGNRGLPGRGPGGPAHPPSPPPATPAAPPGAQAGPRRWRGPGRCCPPPRPHPHRRNKAAGETPEQPRGRERPASRPPRTRLSRPGPPHPLPRGPAGEGAAPLTSGLLRLFGELAQRGGKAGGRRDLGRQRTAGGGTAAGHQGAIERRGGEGVDGGGGPGRGGKHP